MLCIENGTDAATASVSGLGIPSSQTHYFRMEKKRNTVLAGSNGLNNSRRGKWESKNHLLNLYILILDEVLEASDGSVLL